MTDLAVPLEEVVLSVPGVESLYPSAPVVVAIADAAIGSIARGREQRHPISISEAGEGVTVSVAIGIGEAMPATDVCRRTHDAIAAYLLGAGRQVISIEVRVGSIG